MAIEKQIADILDRWLPVEMIKEEGEAKFRWIYTGEINYNMPFFDEVLNKARGLEENMERSALSTPADLLPGMAEQLDSLGPDAIIFHISRCGSTLISQALGMLDGAISIAEAPLFDEILRLSVYGTAVEQSNIELWLQAAIKFYGVKRTGNESRFFLKTDSWHLLFHKHYRAIFQDVPFVIMYRHPGEVLESNNRRKGIQGIISQVPPEIYGFKNLDTSYAHPDNYMALVLEKFYNCILDIAGSDPHVLLVNYNEGFNSMIGRITDFIGLKLSDDESERIESRGKYHAKNPNEKFTELNEAEYQHPKMNDLLELYKQIDKIRAQ